MSLRERMRGIESETTWNRFRKYGVLANPFLAAALPIGHQRREDEVDDLVVDRVRQFEAAGRQSQVVTVEGPRGVGKTNLLNYYEAQFRDYYQEDEAFYIILHFPDPEPTFDALLRKAFRNLDESHFAAIGRRLAQSGVDLCNQAKEIARGYEVKIVLNSLEQAGADRELITERARLALEWFVGLPVLKRHRQELGVSFRLDTVESRTRALRDIVYVSEALGLLKGILLLLDELEKQDYSLNKTPVLRFLSAIRALIDALPRCLFLMLAMTPQARLRYFAMLPALAGRLQDRIELTSLGSLAEAQDLGAFYLQNAREAARSHPQMTDGEPGTMPFPSADRVSVLFKELLRQSEERGTEGVTQRDFLHRLHEEWERTAEPRRTA